MPPPIYTFFKTGSIFNIHRCETGTYTRTVHGKQHSRQKILLCHTCILALSSLTHTLSLSICISSRRVNGRKIVCRVGEWRNNTQPPMMMTLPLSQRATAERKKLLDNKIYDKKTIDREIGIEKFIFYQLRGGFEVRTLRACIYTHTSLSLALLQKIFARLSCV